MIDPWNRERASVDAEFRLTGRCAGKTLPDAALQQGWSKAITVDNGTMFTFRVGPKVSDADDKVGMDAFAKVLTTPSDE